MAPAARGLLLLALATLASADTTFVVPLEHIAKATVRTDERASKEILVGMAQAIPAEGPNGTHYWDKDVTIRKAADVSWKRGATRHWGARGAAAWGRSGGG